MAPNQPFAEILLPVIEPVLDLRQVPRPMLLGHAPAIIQNVFRIPPEALDAVEVSCNAPVHE